MFIKAKNKVWRSGKRVSFHVLKMNLQWIYNLHTSLINKQFHLNNISELLYTVFRLCTECKNWILN